MSELLYVSTTYKSPTDDIESVRGFNDDGTTNIKYTLTAWKNLLEHNLSLVKKLIKNSSSITSIEPVDGKITIFVDPNPNLQKLINDGFLFGSVEDTDIVLSEPDESNHQRLTMLTNILRENQDELNVSDEDVDDEIFKDTRNTQMLLNKFYSVIENNLNDSSDSNDSNDENRDNFTNSRHISEENSENDAY